LTSVTIPDSVTSIGNNAFYGCTSLTSIVVDQNNRIYSSHNGVLYDKAITLLICYPSGKSGDFTIPYRVVSIVELAFYGCSGLTSVVIPNSITTIEAEVFSYCSSLTSVTIPDSVTSIGKQAFRECSGLTSVTIGNSVDSIGNEAFVNCTSLTTAYFLGNAPSMGLRVFYGCSPNFIVCFTAGSTGFAPPSWEGYPAAVCAPSTTTTTTPPDQCAAEALYGSKSEETELLREYRDKVLSKSASGRQMIKTYYELSPAVTEVLQKDDTAKASTRRVLDSIMPAIREKVKQ
jgi:hypothetical protein